MAAPTIYRSSDASAPVLTGTAGDLVNLLDKCLVNGYGAKSAAGWTRNTGFAGNSSTRAVFRQGAGNQFYLDVDDRGATGVLTGASGKEAAVRAYEAMTDVSTGTNPFPTTAQVAANTANWRKSNTADGVPRAWILIADDRTFHLFILTGDTASVYLAGGFGDFYSLQAGDSYRTMISLAATANALGTRNLETVSTGAQITSAATGNYVARTLAGTGTSLGVVKLIYGSTVTAGQTVVFAPDGNWYLFKFYLGDSNSGSYLRGWMRGFWQLVGGPVAALNDGDTLAGSGDLAGRNFLVIKSVGNSGTAVLVETTAWDTSS